MSGVISRRGFLGAAKLFFAGWVLGSRHLYAMEKKKANPNVLVIVSDQQHFRAMGAIDPFYHTPNLDGLARRSVLFHNAYATTPQCSPSRSSIYTGLMPHRTGVISNMGAFYRDGERIIEMREDLKTAADYFGEAGYITSYVGKWHLGVNQGHRERFDLGVFDTIIGGDSTTDSEKTDRSIELLETAVNQEKPFALFVNFKQPHDIYRFGYWDKPEAIVDPGEEIPLPVSYRQGGDDGKPAHLAKFMESGAGSYFFNKDESYWRYYRAFYRDLVAKLDVQVGRFLEWIERKGVAGNTIILFTSDHGDMDTAHRLVYKGPFMYEETVHVPLIVHIPPSISAKAPIGVRDTLVSGVDILPTLLDLVGVSIPVGLDGRSFKDQVMGRQGDFREFVIAEYYGTSSLIHPIRMLRSKIGKYILHHNCEREYYDLVNDGRELVNQYGNSKYESAIREAESALEKWLRVNDASFLEKYIQNCALDARSK